MRDAGERLNGKNIFDAAKAGDETAKELVARFLDYIAQGAANIANSIGVRAIVIGGGISKEGQYVADEIHEIVKNTMYCGDMFAPEIRMATLGNDAGIIGAAALACHC